jgi:hypothetical protein
VFRIGRNTFYDWKNKIQMKILEFKGSGIGLITEFCGIPNGFPNKAFLYLPLEPLLHPFSLAKYCTVIAAIPC